MDENWKLLIVELISDKNTHSKFKSKYKNCLKITVKSRWYISTPRDTKNTKNPLQYIVFATMCILFLWRAKRQTTDFMQKLYSGMNNENSISQII